ncbi:MAG: hypothetical protein AB7K09_10855, partial [Planctomycetota bacterium]
TAPPSYRMALSAEVEAPMRTIHLWMTVTHAEVDVDVEAVFSAECELGTAGAGQAIGDGRWVLEVHQRQIVQKQGGDEAGPYSLWKTIELVAFTN